MSQGENLSRLPISTMFAIATLLVSAIAYLSYENGRARAEATEQSQISREVLDATTELLSALQDAETGQRGFVITGREEYLGPYNNALAAIPRILTRIEAVTPRREDQGQRLADLRPSIDAKFQELAATVELRRTQGFAAAAGVVNQDRGRQLMDEIRARADEVRNIAEQRTVMFNQEAERSGRLLRAVSTIGSLILLALLAVTGAAVLRGLKHRETLYRQAAANAEHFRVTLSSIGDAVIATDAERKITFINPVAVKLTGWSESEAVGTPIQKVFRIVNETTRKIVENPLDKAIETGTVVGLANHTVLIAKDGSEMPIDDSGAPIRGAQGGILGAILVFRDISERRNIETQLRNSNEQLKEFVDAAAHDLRTPLRSLNTFSHLLAQRLSAGLGEDESNYLDFIRSSAMRMDHLLEALLSYARASHFDPPEGPLVSMNDALASAMENLRVDIEENQARVTADSLPSVPCHSGHLVRLFQNLIGNAIKYRGEAPPVIHVSCESVGNGWRVQVRDNGIGIAAAHATEIFKPFKRLHNEERSGSGIGLATCSKIISGYGGEIWVESEPGVGSRFLFTIPSAGAASQQHA